MALLPFSRVDRTPTKPNATRSTVLVAVACVAMANSASASSGIDKDAPVLVETTVDVAAPPEVVWEVLTEPARWASWNELIASAWIEGSVAEGSLIEWTTAPEAGGFTIRSEIILAEQNRVLEWRGIGGDMVALHSWRLEPIAGGTRVHNDESVRGGEAESMPETLRAQFAWFLESWNTALGREIERRLRDCQIDDDLWRADRATTHHDRGPAPCRRWVGDE